MGEEPAQRCLRGQSHPTSGGVARMGGDAVDITTDGSSHFGICDALHGKIHGRATVMQFRRGYPHRACHGHEPEVAGTEKEEAPSTLRLKGRIGGGGGNRTRVRKHYATGHYMLSPFFN